MPRTIIAGLDIGTAAIRLVVCEASKDKKNLRVLAQAKKDSHGLRRGYIVNFEETLKNLKEVIQEAERQSKVKIRSVFLGLGGVTLETRESIGQVAVSKADLEVTEADINRAIEASENNLGDFANRRVLQNVPLLFKLDGKKVLGRPGGMKGSKLEVKVLFINCLNQHLGDLVRVVEAAGLTVEDVVASPIASSLPTLSTAQKSAGCLLANIGSQTTSIIVFEDGIPLSLQVFPLGSNDVTNDIALGLRVSIEEAEKMKLDTGSTLSLKRKLEEIIEARLVDMLELIEAHLKKIGRNGLLPAGIVVIGGGASADNLEKLAKTNLKLPAKIFDPQNESHLKNQIKNSTWLTAYGLCIYGLYNEPERLTRFAWQELGLRLLRWFKEFWP